MESLHTEVNRLHKKKYEACFSALTTSQKHFEMHAFFIPFRNFCQGGNPLKFLCKIVIGHKIF